MTIEYKLSKIDYFADVLVLFGIMTSESQHSLRFISHRYDALIVLSLESKTQLVNYHCNDRHEYITEFRNINKQLLLQNYLIQYYLIAKIGLATRAESARIA